MLQGFSHSTLGFLVVWQVYLASQEVRQVACLEQDEEVEEVEAALDVSPETDELEVACHEELHSPRWLSCFRKIWDVNWGLYQHIF